MARAVRPDPVGGTHHVMNRGARRWDVFLDDCDRRFFFKMLGEMNERFGIKVLAYCLMDNHYHLVIRCPDGGLSASMKHLSENYTRAFNGFHGYDGSLFRSRFTSKLIESDRYLLDATRYVQRNPVEVGFDPVRYPWSSFRIYLRHRPTPPWFDDRTAVDLMGGAEAYTNFVLADRRDDEVPLAEAVRVKPSSPRLSVASAPHLISDVARLAGVAPSDIITPRNGVRTTTARAVAMVLAAELGTASSRDLAQLFGLGSSGSFRVAASRARQMIESNPEASSLWRLVNSV